jgi:hypothetical protein
MAAVKFDPPAIVAAPASDGQPRISIARIAANKAYVFPFIVTPL